MQASKQAIIISSMNEVNQHLSIQARNSPPFTLFLEKGKAFLPELEEEAAPSLL